MAMGRTVTEQTKGVRASKCRSEHPQPDNSPGVGGSVTASSKDRNQGMGWQAHTGELPCPGGPPSPLTRMSTPRVWGPWMTIWERTGQLDPTSSESKPQIRLPPSLRSSGTSKDLRVTNRPVTRIHLLCCVTGQGFHGSLLTQKIHVGTHLSLLEGKQVPLQACHCFPQRLCFSGSLCPISLS